MLDPRQLQIFIVAAETENFSLAAKKLNLSQPSITQNIQSLESQIGEQLFQRSGNKVVLTTSGEALLPLARQLISVNLRVEELMDHMRDETFGNLFIACTTTPGKYLLPVVLANFMQIYPWVKAACQVMPRNQALGQLENGQVHFAFSSSSDELGRDIEFIKFLTDPLVLIAPKGHEWARKGEIDLAEFVTGRFITREETAGTYRVLRTGLAKKGINISDLQIALTMGSSEGIAIAVQQGVGVAYVSRTLHRHVSLDKVAEVTVRGLEFAQDIFFCRHRLQSNGKAQNAFWEYIQNINPILSDRDLSVDLQLAGPEK